MLVLDNEGGGPHHMQGRHTWDLRIGLRKLVFLTLNTIIFSIEAKHKFS